MKKRILIIISVILAVIIGVSVPFIVNSDDKLVSSSVSSLDDETYLLDIETKKQELNTRCTFSIEKQHLGENYYLYRFVFNQQMLQTLAPAYSVDYLDVSFGFDNNDEILSAYAVSDKSEGYKSIKVHNGELHFTGDSGYMEIEFVMNNSEPENEIELNIKCALAGNGFNALNRIYGIEHKITL